MRQNVVNNWNKLHPDLRGAMIDFGSEILNDNGFTANAVPLGTTLREMYDALADRGLLEPELHRLETSIIRVATDRNYPAYWSNFQRTGKYRLTERGAKTLRLRGRGR